MDSNDSREFQSLQTAIDNNNLDEIKQCLKQHFFDYDIDEIYVTSSEIPLLHYAIMNNATLDILNFLLKRDPFPFLDLYDSDGRTPLLIAIQEGNLECLKLLLKHGANIEKGRSIGNLTPLEMSIWKEHHDCFKFLLEQGANPNNLNMYGKTPLIMAAKRGFFQHVYLLLQSGANIHTVHLNKNALDYAQYHANKADQKEELTDRDHGYINCVEILQEHAKTSVECLDILKSSIDFNYLDVIQACLAHHAMYLNNLVISPSKDTLLIYAIQNNATIECIELLLDCDVDINYQRKISKVAALHMAGYNRNFECVKLLLKHGANVDIQQSNGRTSLIFAIDKGQDQFVKLLLDHGADVTIQDKFNNSALTYAHRIIIDIAYKIETGQELTSLEIKKNKCLHVIQEYLKQTDQEHLMIKEIEAAEVKYQESFNHEIDFRVFAKQIVDASSLEEATIWKEMALEKFPDKSKLLEKLVPGTAAYRYFKNI